MEAQNDKEISVFVSLIMTKLNQKILIKQKNLVLKLVGIDYLRNKDNYEINLIFDNNAYISLSTETIEVRLEDQNEIK